jgi:hypothetical protein
MNQFEVNWKLIKNELKMNYELIINALQVNYEWSMDYEVTNENTREWSPLIM